MVAVASEGEVTGWTTDAFDNRTEWFGGWNAEVELELEMEMEPCAW